MLHKNVYKMDSYSKTITILNKEEEEELWKQFSLMNL